MIARRSLIAHASVVGGATMLHRTGIAAAFPSQGFANRWWAPQSGVDFETGQTSRLVQSAIGKAVGRPRQPLTSAEAHSIKFLAVTIDTSHSRYVWPPIRFDGTRPVIEWRDQ